MGSEDEDQFEGTLIICSCWQLLRLISLNTPYLPWYLARFFGSGFTITNVWSYQMLCYVFAIEIHAVEEGSIVSRLTLTWPSFRFGNPLITVCRMDWYLKQTRGAELLVLSDPKIDSQTSIRSAPATGCRQGIKESTVMPSSLTTRT